MKMTIGITYVGFVDLICLLCFMLMLLISRNLLTKGSMVRDLCERKLTNMFPQSQIITFSDYDHNVCKCKSDY